MEEVPETPRRALVIMAHPDDAEFTCGGTVARWVREGAEVIYALCTDGERGCNDPHCDPFELGRLRKEEQRAACRVLGVKEVVFLGYPDGTLQHTLLLRRDLTRLIRQYRPDTVLCGDPTVRFARGMYLNHPDHRAAADAALDAVYPSAGSYWIFPELLDQGLKPHNVDQVFLATPQEPNYWVDITDTLEAKIQALKCHQSQVGDVEDLEERIRAWAEMTAQGHGMRYAEAFRRLVLRR
ncbi:MAG: PIG-L deacetylase family protein [Anaerolineae bacterium]